MKRIKRFLYVIISLIVLFPCMVNAAYIELSAGTQNPIVGDIVFVQLEVNGLEPFLVKDFHVNIFFDESFFTVEDIIWIKNREHKGTAQITSGKVQVDKTNGAWDSGPILQLRLRVKKQGNTRINVDHNGESYYTDGNNFAYTPSEITIVAKNPSSETQLRRIWIDGYTLEPPYSSTTTKYNLKVPSHVSFINVNATQAQENQKITGTGSHQLQYGDNKIRVISTAQNGDQRTYEIMVTRVDDRTGDTSLKSIDISDGTVTYNSKKGVYEALVSKNIESVMLTGITNDPKATMTGTGKKELAIGENKFVLKITSSNGRKQEYTIIITRSNEELEKEEKSSKLTKLKINNLILNIEEENKIFYFGVGKEQSSLSIETETESKTAKVEITGNEKFTEGLNIIDIKVIEVLEEATETEEALEDITEYKVIVYKNPKSANVIEDLTKLNSNSNYVYITTNKNQTIPSASINALNDKFLYYNVVNMSNGLLYQLKIPSGISKTDIKASLKKEDEGNLTYLTELPAGIEVLLNIENLYEDGDDLKIYSKDAEGNYNLITAGVKVLKGYIKFETTGDTNYVITKTELFKEKGPFEKFLEQYGIKIGLGFIGIVATLLLINFITKKIEEKDKDEPF